MAAAAADTIQNRQTTMKKAITTEGYVRENAGQTGDPQHTPDDTAHRRHHLAHPVDHIDDVVLKTAPAARVSIPTRVPVHRASAGRNTFSHCRPRWNARSHLVCVVVAVAALPDFVLMLPVLVVLVVLVVDRMERTRLRARTAAHTGEKWTTGEPPSSSSVRACWLQRRSTKSFRTFHVHVCVFMSVACGG